MKIERISENQIRCTLNREDLEEKEIRLSELAYGTDKAKELFRDMMQQAQIELGFEADETPLMIEAIPVNPDCLILVITKVSDPEELDTRFSRFTKPFPNTPEEDEDDIEDFDDGTLDMDFEIPGINKENLPKGVLPGADKILKALGSLAEGLSSAAIDALNKKNSEQGSDNKLNKNSTPGSIAPKAFEKENSKDAANKTANDTAKETVNETVKNAVAIFRFKSLQDIIKSCAIVNKSFGGSSCLYKDEINDEFYLIVSRDMTNDIEFLKVCSVFGEYGESFKGIYATASYFHEHYKCMIREDAVETLYDISSKK